jgi:hypothetical protein
MLHSDRFPVRGNDELVEPSRLLVLIHDKGAAITVCDPDGIAVLHQIGPIDFPLRRWSSLYRT